MPLFYQHNINDSARLAIWRITEDEPFFLRKVPLPNNITHWHKRLQHLAGRYLLQHLYFDFPYDLIRIAGTKKPFLPDQKYHFSISHCGDFAAAIVSENLRVGIDIELVTEKIKKVSTKFLTDAENNLITDGRVEDLTMLWSCKEAIFKWYSEGGLDFKKNMTVDKIFKDKNGRGKIACSFCKNEKQEKLNLEFQFFENLCLVFLAL